MKKMIFIVFITMLAISHVMAIDLNSELLRLAVLDNPDEIASIIDKGANIEAKDPWGETALILSSGNGNIDNVKNLLDRGADINAVSGSKIDCTYESCSERVYQCSKCFIGIRRRC